MNEIACLLAHLLRCIKGRIGRAIKPLMRLVDEPKFCAIFVQLISSAALGNLADSVQKISIETIGLPGIAQKNRVIDQLWTLIESYIDTSLHIESARPCRQVKPVFCSLDCCMG